MSNPGEFLRAASTFDAHLRNHVLPTFGRRQLASIRPTEVQAWVKSLGATLAPTTVETVARVAVSIFRAAVRDRLITHSPADGVKVPKVDRRKVEPLTVHEVQALADGMGERLAPLVLVSAQTGLRQGEVLGLTVDRVDFLRRSVTVDRQMTRAGTFGPPKTSASYRTVPVASVTVELLAAQLERWGSDPERGLIFGGRQGWPLSSSGLNDAWRRARRASGVEAKFHDLRHHYASLLIHSGASVKVVQERLGHASAAETLEVYSHLWPGSDDQTRDAVASAWARSGVSTSCPEATSVI